MGGKPLHSMTCFLDITCGPESLNQTPDVFVPPADFLGGKNLISCCGVVAGYPNKRRARLFGWPV